MLVRLLGSEVVQRSHVLQEGGEGKVSSTSTRNNLQVVSVIEMGAYRFLDDVEALLVDLEVGHFLNDLLQQDVLLVAVAFNGELRHSG